MARKKQIEVEPQGDTLVQEKTGVFEPKKYVIIMHNDDYTTQEFVVHILVDFFYKNTADAQRIMLKIHLEGQAMVGIFSKDMAESKVSYITAYCQKSGMPLRMTTEPL